MANSDISLLFGVLGDGALSGESGSLIQSQLGQIVSALNKSPLKVKVGLDTEAGGQKSWGSQLQTKLNSVSASDKFSIKVSKLSLGAGAITDFKSQLAAVVNTLNLDKGTSITLSSEGIGEIKAKMKEASSATDEAIQKVAAFNSQLKIIDIQSGNVGKSVKSIFSSATTDEERTKIDGITAQYQQWLTKIEEVRASKTAASSTYQAELTAEGVKIQDSINALLQARQASADATAAKQAEAKARQAAAAADARAAEAARVAEEKARQAAEAARLEEEKRAKQESDLLSAIETKRTAIQNKQLQWNAAANGLSSSEYLKFDNYIDRLTQLGLRVGNTKENIEVLRKELSNINTDFRKSSSVIQQTGENTKTLSSHVGSLATKFTSWLTISQVVMRLYTGLRQMVSAVIEIDSAMTELKKVTEETDVTYTKFLENAISRSKTLGATVTDTVNASADFARLGYTLNEAASLADAAIVYKNVGDGIEDISTASESIISTMKAFGVEATDAMSIVDKFNEVGNNFAISSVGIGDALTRSASALAAGNNTLEESIALITAANSVVQDADKVGTTMKTVSMFLRAAKTEAEDAGESTEGMANSVSELRDELLSLTGGKVDIQIDEDTFKSTYQIIKELSSVWENLTDITQANILEMVGGKRNSNVVASLIDNFETADEVMKSVANSAGSALIENEKQLASIEGRINLFKASFEAFSFSIINSDLVKIIIDIGAGLLNLLTLLQEIHMLIPLITASIAVVKGISIAKQFAESTAKVAALTTSMAVQKSVTTGLQLAVSALNAKEKELLATELARAVVAGEIDAAIASQILGELELAGVTTGVTAANKKLAVSFKSVMASVPVWGWIALGVSVVIEVISALTTKLENSRNELEELESEFDTLRNTINSVASEFRSLSDSSATAIPRFAELAKGVNKLGENVSLTDEEYAEFLALNNQIAEMFPELNLGMDSSGNAMLSLSYSADTLTSSLNALVEAQRNAAHQEIADTMPDVIENIKSSNEKYRDEIDELKDAQSEYEDVYDDILNRSLPTNIGRYSTQAAGEKAAREFIAMAQELGMHGDVLMDSQSTINNGYAFSVKWDYDSLDFGTDYIEEQYNIAIERYDKLINDYKNKIEAKWAQLNPVVSSWMQTDFMYQDLSGSMQEVARVMVSGLDFSSLGLTTQEDVQKYVDDNIIEPIFLATPKAQEAFSEITNWQNDLKNGTMSSDEFSENIHNAFNDMFSTMSSGEIETFKSIFVNSFSEMGIEGTDFITVLDGLISEWGRVSTEAQTTSDSLTSLKDTISTLSSAYDILSQAKDDMSSGGLSADTLSSLSEIDDNYLDYLYEENGVIKLNIDAWNKRSIAIKDSEIAAVQSSINAIEEENAAIQSQIDYYKEQQANSKYSGDYSGWAKLIRDETDRLEENNYELSEKEKLLSVINNVYNSIYNNASNNLSEVFDGISSSLSDFSDLQGIVSNGYLTTVTNALELASVYPQILESAQTTATGEIQLNEDVVNSFISGKEAEIQGNAKAEAEKLTAKRAVLQANLDIIKSQISAAQTGDSEDVKSANDAAVAKIAIQQAVLSAAEQAGIDETTANQLALAAMNGDWDTFTTLAQNAVYDLDDESALSFTSVMNNFATMSQNMVDNTNQVIGAFSTMGEALKNAMDGVTTDEYNANIKFGSVTGEGKEAIDGLMDEMFEETKSAYGDSTPDLTDSLTDWETKLQEIVDNYSVPEVDIDSLLAEQSSLVEQIAALDGQIAILNNIANTPLDKFTYDISDIGGDTDGASDVDEYVVDIERFREALEKLSRVQIEKDALEFELSNTSDLKKQIELEERLLGIYQDEQDALHAVNNLRDAEITNSVSHLESIGFDVEYDHENNQLYIKNMEHINELVAENKGEYGSLQEATNAYREDTESLIDTITDFNQANQENSDSWWELQASIKDAKIAIVDINKEIVAQSSEMLDTLQSVYETLTDAATEYAEYGFITVDSLQSIIDLGTEYMAFLQDENGQLVINEDNIKKVIAARTEQLAVESALSYVSQLRLALDENNTSELQRLLTATSDATNATWGLVYANLALLDLDDTQYASALRNIDNLRALATNASDNIYASLSGDTSSRSDALEEQRDALDSILDYTMELVKWEAEQQVAALESQVSDYEKMVALKKEMLEATKDEADYEDEVADKITAIAKLQERINALALDDSRDATAQRTALEEEMAGLQSELADYQSDYMVDAHGDALDDMADAYSEEKEKEIAMVEDTVSSTEKVYQLAIERINSDWDGLYKDLLSYNYEYGSTLQDDLVSAWNAASIAVQEYGGYVSALGGIDSDLNDLATGGSSGTSGSIVGTTSSTDEAIHNIISLMWKNSQAYGSVSESEKEELSDQNLNYGRMLSNYGIDTYRDANGAWWVDGGNELLYDKYKDYIYHNGGIAGDAGTLKENELLATLERGEAIISNKSKDSLFSLIDFVGVLSKKLSDRFFPEATANIPDVTSGVGKVASNGGNSVQFGDVYITGANEDTIEKHRDINRQFVNDVLKQLNIRK